jgi:Tfp pilus assembly protein PilN
MMIQINLLPGAKKGTRGSAGLSLPSSFSAVGSGVRDPWLLAAAASVVIAVSTVGLLFTAQSARAGEVGERLERALRDSTRYEKVLSARATLAAERDSVYRQLQIIRTIDDNRYNWAHILDEVSRALPANTWLTTLEQTTKAPLPPGLDSTASAKPAGKAKAAAAKDAPGNEGAALAAADSISVHPPLGFRLVGQTVDIQALTMFMRQLESSHFVQKVALTKSEIVIVDGKDVTQFELSAEYEVPPAGVIRTSPLIVPVR